MTENEKLVGEKSLTWYLRGRRCWLWDRN